jgi:hypothetical protein
VYKTISGNKDFYFTLLEEKILEVLRQERLGLHNLGTIGLADSELDQCLGLLQTRAVPEGVATLCIDLVDVNSIADKPRPGLGAADALKDAVVGSVWADLGNVRSDEMH